MLAGDLVPGKGLGEVEGAASEAGAKEVIGGEALDRACERGRIIGRDEENVVAVEEGRKRRGGRGGNGLLALKGKGNGRDLSRRRASLRAAGYGRDDWETVRERRHEAPASK